MSTTFMNSKNSKIFDSHWLLLNHTDKINLLLYQMLACTNMNLTCT